MSPYFFVASERHERQTSIVPAEASTHQPPDPQSAAHVPVADSVGFTQSQLASAEHARRLPVAQAQTNAAITQTPLQDTGKRMQCIFMSVMNVCVVESAILKVSAWLGSWIVINKETPATSPNL